MLKAFNHPIATLREGLNAIVDGEPKPLPLKETHFTIEVENGLALIKTLRVFTNEDERAIEAVLTFPVPFDAVLTGLKAEIDGRKLAARAKLKEAAREEYEEAVSQGKMAILHEEPLRGLHMLSVGQLGSGKTVRIEAEMVMPLATNGSMLYLRLPLVVGEIYGVSPFLPADDLVAVEGLVLTAKLTVSAQGGPVYFAGGRKVESGQQITLDRHLVLEFPDQSFGPRTGIDAWGSKVNLTLKAPLRQDDALDIAVLVDHSGSTNSQLGEGQVHGAMVRGLSAWSRSLRSADKIALWEFDDKADFVGHATGSDLAGLVQKLSPPRGGTELGIAVETVIMQGAKPILVLTDGQTYSHEITKAQEAGCPIHAILVGEGSLDAMIGHLAAQTGGQVIAALQDDVAGALVAMLPALRKGHTIPHHQFDGDRPVTLSTMRGGIKIDVVWSDALSDTAPDAIGRYAASLALSLTEEEVAGRLALAHGLTSHLTSLVIVDEAGEAVAGLPRMVKVPVHASMISFSDVIDDVIISKLISRNEPSMATQTIRAMRNMVGMSEAESDPDADWSLVVFQQLLVPHRLPRLIAERVNLLMADPDIVALAQAIGMKPHAVALLVAAFQDKPRDRNAGRFIRSCRHMVDRHQLEKIERVAGQMAA